MDLDEFPIESAEEKVPEDDANAKDGTSAKSKTEPDEFEKFADGLEELADGKSPDNKALKGVRKTFSCCPSSCVLLLSAGLRR